MNIQEIIKEYLPEGTELSDKAINTIAKEIKAQQGKEFVPMEQYSLKTKELGELENEIADLRAKAAGADDFKAKYDAEVTAHAATKSGYESEKTTAAKTAKLEKLLTEKHGANPKYVAKMAREFKLDDLKDDGDGFKDFDKALEPVKAEWPDMFGTTNTEGFKPATPPASTGGYAGKTIAELMAEANKNPGETDKILSHIETMNNKQTGGNTNV